MLLLSHELKILFLRSKKMSERFQINLFSSDLKEYRKTNKISQEKLAASLGLKTHSMISKLEKGTTFPSDGILNQFCKLANIDENRYWKEKKDEVPFAFLKGQSNGVTSNDIEKLCKNIATQEYLMVLKKKFYEK
jgi:transcriptional regulator with XRE-family HTH domain